MIYLITPVGSSVITEELENRIKSIIPNSSDIFMLPQKNACFVSFDGISTELRDRLHLTGSINNTNAVQNAETSQPAHLPPITAIITAVVPGGYNGYALTQVWEWLNLKSGTI